MSTTKSFVEGFDELIERLEARNRRPIRGFLYRHSIGGRSLYGCLRDPRAMVRDMQRQVTTWVQRARHHYSDVDVWSFCHNNATANLRALQTLRNNLHGYPGQPGAETPREWAALLDQMIAGWQAYVDLDDHTLWPDGHLELQAWETAKYAEFQSAMALYTKWYGHLWD